MTEAEFLTTADVSALTGKSQAKHQVAELERRGIPFILGAQGRPQVSRHHTRLIAEGRPLIEPERQVPGLPQGLKDWQAGRRELAVERQEQERTYRAMMKRTAPERLRAARSAHGAKRRASEICRMPAWADRHAIRAVYADARRMTMETGVEHHVDHEIPLRGKLVSGLHVANNLQVLPAIDNSRKGNKFEPE